MGYTLIEEEPPKGTYTVLEKEPEKGNYTLIEDEPAPGLFSRIKESILPVIPKDRKAIPEGSPLSRLLAIPGKLWDKQVKKDEPYFDFKKESQKENFSQLQKSAFKKDIVLWTRPLSKAKQAVDILLERGEIAPEFEISQAVENRTREAMALIDIVNRPGKKYKYPEGIFTPELTKQMQESVDIMSMKPPGKVTMTEKDIRDGKIKYEIEPKKELLLNLVKAYTITRIPDKISKQGWVDVAKICAVDPENTIKAFKDDSKYEIIWNMAKNAPNIITESFAQTTGKWSAAVTTPEFWIINGMIKKITPVTIGALAQTGKWLGKKIPETVSKGLYKLGGLFGKLMDLNYKLSGKIQPERTAGIILQRQVAATHAGGQSFAPSAANELVNKLHGIGQTLSKTNLGKNEIETIFSQLAEMNKIVSTVPPFEATTISDQANIIMREILDDTATMISRSIAEKAGELMPGAYQEALKKLVTAVVDNETIKASSLQGQDKLVNDMREVLSKEGKTEVLINFDKLIKEVGEFEITTKELSPQSPGEVITGGQQKKVIEIRIMPDGSEVPVVKMIEKQPEPPVIPAEASGTVIPAPVTPEAVVKPPEQVIPGPKASEGETSPGGYKKGGLKEAIELRKESNSLATYGEREQKEWLGGKTPTQEIILYRATPTGESIIPGDYVTNSKEYAQIHIDSDLAGNGKITEIKATLDDIYPADAPKEFWYAPKSIEESKDKMQTGKTQEDIKKEIDEVKKRIMDRKKAGGKVLSSDPDVLELKKLQQRKGITAGTRRKEEQTPRKESWTVDSRPARIAELLEKGRNDLQNEKLDKNIEQQIIKTEYDIITQSGLSDEEISRYAINTYEGASRLRNMARAVAENKETIQRQAKKLQEDYKREFPDNYLNTEVEEKKAVYDSDGVRIYKGGKVLNNMLGAVLAGEEYGVLPDVIEGKVRVNIRDEKQLKDLNDALKKIYGTDRKFTMSGYIEPRLSPEAINVAKQERKQERAGAIERGEIKQKEKNVKEDSIKLISDTVPDVKKEKLNTFAIEKIYTDELTRLLNRHYYKGAEREAGKKIDNEEYSPMFEIDIDFFKAINDTYGHIFGDEVLRKTAQAFREAHIYNAIRAGGEEFFIPVKGDPNETYKKIIKARDILESMIIGLGGIKHKGIKLSGGFGINMKQADEALYKAKSDGRNQIRLDKSELLVYNSMEGKQYEYGRIKEQSQVLYSRGTGEVSPDSSRRSEYWGQIAWKESEKGVLWAVDTADAERRTSQEILSKKASSGQSDRLLPVSSKNVRGIKDIVAGPSEEYKNLEVADRRTKKVQEVIGPKNSSVKVTYEETGKIIFPNTEITSPEDIAWAIHEIGNSREVLYAIGLKQGKLAAIMPISMGEISSTSASIYEFVSFAKAFGIDELISWHNHPSGNSELSEADHLTFERLKKALAGIGVKNSFNGVSNGRFSYKTFGGHEATEEYKEPISGTKEEPVYQVYQDLKSGELKTINDAPSAAQILKSLTVDIENNETVLYLNTHNNVVGINIYPGPLTVGKILNDAVAVRAVKVLISGKTDEVEATEISDLLKQYEIRLLDVIHIKGDSYTSENRDGDWEYTIFEAKEGPGAYVADSQQPGEPGDLAGLSKEYVDKMITEGKEGKIDTLLNKLKYYLGLKEERWEAIFNDKEKGRKAYEQMRTLDRQISGIGKMTETRNKKIFDGISEEKRKELYYLLKGNNLDKIQKYAKNNPEVNKVLMRYFAKTEPTEKEKLGAIIPPFSKQVFSDLYGKGINPLWRSRSEDLQEALTSGQIYAAIRNRSDYTFGEILTFGIKPIGANVLSGYVRINPADPTISRIIDKNMDILAPLIIKGPEDLKNYQYPEAIHREFNWNINPAKEDKPLAKGLLVGEVKERIEKQLGLTEQIIESIKEHRAGMEQADEPVTPEQEKLLEKMNEFRNRVETGLIHLAQRNESIMGGLDVDTREAIFYILKGIEKLEAGKLIFGAVQPAGVIYDKNARTGQELRDGRIIGDPTKDGGRQTYLRVNTEEDYNALIEKNTEVERIIKQYLSDEEKIIKSLMGDDLPAYARNVLKGQYDIISTQPGSFSWVPSVSRGYEVDSLLGNIPSLYKAPGRERRTGALSLQGMEEPDFQKALTTREAEFMYEKIFNSFAGDLLALAIRPVGPEGVKPGNVNLQDHTERLGEILERKKDVLLAAGIDIEKKANYQLPETVNQVFTDNKKPSIILKGLATIQPIMDKVMSTILTNYLLRPSTTGRNNVSGAIQYSNRVLTGMYEGILNGLDMTALGYDIKAIGRSLKPDVWKELPREVLGSTFYQDIHGNWNPMQKALIPFESVEVFWKRATFDAELNNLAHKSYQAKKGNNKELIDGKTGEIISAKQYIKDFRENHFQDVFQHLADESDSVTYDYWNKPWVLEKISNVVGKSIIPYPNYAYHYLRLAGEYGPGALLDMTKENWKHQTSKFLAGLTMWTIALLYAGRASKKRKEEMEELKYMKMPYEFDTVGRIKVYGNDKISKYLRVYDLPYIGDAMYIQEIRNRNADLDEWIGDRMTTGPMFNLAQALIGIRFPEAHDRYQRGKPIESILGEQFAGFIPFGAYLNYIRILADPVKRKTYSKDYTDFENFINPLKDKIPVLSEKTDPNIARSGPEKGFEREYDIETETLKFFFINIKSIDNYEYESLVIENLGKKGIEREKSRQKRYEKMNKERDLEE